MGKTVRDCVREALRTGGIMAVNDLSFVVENSEFVPNGREQQVDAVDRALTGEGGDSNA